MSSLPEVQPADLPPQLLERLDENVLKGMF